MRNAARLLVATLFLSLPLFGQYGWNATVTLADNTAWCATGNCLTSIGGVTVETKAGVDGTIYGLNSAGVIFTYTQAAGWVEAASALQKPGAWPSNISRWGMRPTSSRRPQAPTMFISSTPPRPPGHFWLGAEPAPMVKLVRMATSGALPRAHWVKGVWTNIPGTASSLSVGDANNVWIANSASSLFTFNSSGGWSVVSPGFAVSAALNAIAAGGETAVAAIDTSGKIHVSANSGATWSTILGTASSIAGGGPMTFVRSSSGVSYHLNLTVLSLSVPGYGTWPCPPNACEQGGNCAPGCVGENTVSATAKFGGVGGAHGTAGVTAKQTAPPSTYINIQATEEATFCDVFYIEDGYTQECEAIGNGTALDGTGRGLGSFSDFPPIVAGLRLSAAVFSGLSNGRCTWTPTCSGTCSTPYTTNTFDGQCYQTGPYRHRLCNWRGVRNISRYLLRPDKSRRMRLSANAASISQRRIGGRWGA